MTRLVKVELVRLLCRRAVLVLLAAAVVVPVVIGVATVVNTAPPSDDDVAEAERVIAEERASRWARRSLERCVDNPRRYGVSPGSADLAAACEDAVLPRVEDYLWYEPLSLADERDNGSGVAVVVVLALLLMLAGTTFAGHDWNSGSVSNQLLFEPRRLRVWLAKAVAVAAVAALLATVVLTLYWLALGWVASSRDLRVGDGVLLDCLQMGWRGAATATVAAVTGFALTMLFRSTVATLGILAGVGLAGGMILTVIGLGTVWNPGLNLLAVVLDGATYWETGACPGSPGSTCEVERQLSLGRGLGYWGVLVVGAVGASVLSFRRRDVG